MSTAAVNSPMVAKRALTAYWIIRLRQFGSRPAAKLCQVPWCAARTGRPVAVHAPVIKAAPGGVSGPRASTTARLAARAAAQSARAATAVSAPGWNRFAACTVQPFTRSVSAIAPQISSARKGDGSINARRGWAGENRGRSGLAVRVPSKALMACVVATRTGSRF